MIKKQILLILIYKNWVDEVKNTNTKYMKDINFCDNQLIENKGMGNSGFTSKEKKKGLKVNPPKHNIYIFGHSLDNTDGDIIRDLILNDNVYTTIFYHNKKELGKKIANLVKVIGQDELIKKTGGSTKTIEFKLQKDMIKK